MISLSRVAVVDIHRRLLLGSVLPAVVKLASRYQSHNGRYGFSVPGDLAEALRRAGQQEESQKVSHALGYPKDFIHVIASHFMPMWDKNGWHFLTLQSRS